MKKNILTLFLLSGALLSCSVTGNEPKVNQQTAAQPTGANTVQEKPLTKQETIYGIKYQGNTLSIQVMSNGCTTTKNFKQAWQNNQLTLERIKDDFCRRRPHKKWLDFELPQAFSSLKLINKLAS
ncbi:hypothetical protein SG34_023415 [Thalassomonas viridans]|uniref:Lipoprotein n=1 Tax=Thalassomonas viridans TaxID=137584 RepID=A0AAF0C8K0_9GAMM|nr:hypothetical protein [Thalassomonas viridans]WDE04260.1 hypothetical protein SG34_023415 [Thalassomonas viridans]